MIMLNFIQVDVASSTATKGDFFIHSMSNDGKLILKILQQSSAFHASVDKTSECILKWANNLQLPPLDYLQQLQDAIDSTGSKHYCPTYTKCSNKQEKHVLNSPTQAEHIFEITKDVLSWKQYFPAKKVHGKRGSIPLINVDPIEATWSVMRDVALQQTTSAQRMQEIQQQNKCLEKECEEAKDIARRSALQQQHFKQQTYAKFCTLINEKKERIRQLILNKPDAAVPSTSGNTDVSTTYAPAAVTRPTDLLSDGADEFDDDTDVDDPCDTDEEKEGAEQTAAANRKRITNSNAIGDVNTKKDGLSSGKRKETISGLCLHKSKKVALSDSCDDIFNNSMDGGSRASLLSAIQPRRGAME